MIASDLEKQISRIPLVTKIINTESCLLIYSYLTLYGKTTPVELRQRINLSKATVFRSLALLTEAGIVSKEMQQERTAKPSCQLRARASDVGCVSSRNLLVTTKSKSRSTNSSRIPMTEEPLKITPKTSRSSLKRCCANLCAKSRMFSFIFL